MSRAHKRGSSAVEMALVAPIFILFVFGMIDFSLYFESRVSITNAATDAARFAATSGNSASPSFGLDFHQPAQSNSIEAVVQANSGTAKIPNDNSHIQIKYFVNKAGSADQCAAYSVAANNASGSIVYIGAYTQATCMTTSTSIQVTVIYQYRTVTPVIGKWKTTGVTITETAAALEEQT